MTTFISTMGVKSQVTLPKNIRKILQVKPGDPIGFVVDGSKVIVCRADIGPSHDPFTQEEWEKISTLFKTNSGKTYHSHKKSMLHLKRLMK